MGRHSAQPRNAARLKRVISNSLTVLAVTLATALALYAGITTHAVARSHEIPDPTIFADSPAHEPHGWRKLLHATEPIPEPTVEATVDTAVRQCPATGCTAATCHAETGEPIPRR